MPSLEGTARRSSIRRADNANDDPLTTLQFTLRPEAVRFFAYGAFWSMCIIAIILARYVVHPLLLAGPTDGKSCPPFETGEGFDLYTDSHLVRVLGYNNICANWDYSPAREILAVYFPLFEYALILYILTDYANVALHWKKGLVSTRCYRAFQLLFLPIIFGSAMFRMIFVIIAYEDVAGHTAGFLCLQVSLFLVAIMNVWFVVESKIDYRFLCGRIEYFAYAYLAGNIIISSIKLYLTCHVVFTSTQAEWALTDVGRITLGQLIDGVWMVFNAIIPFALCYVRMKTENPLEIKINVQALPCFLDATSLGLDQSTDEPVNHGNNATTPPRGRLQKKRNSLSLWQAPDVFTEGGVSRPPREGCHPRYPFENVVFQGGGAKGTVYTGVIQALGELGMLPYLKRFAGASAGCLAALTLALGLDAGQACEEMMNTNINDFFDANRVQCAYNLNTKYGMHPAKKLVEYLEDLLERYTGNKNLTFLELYQRYGTELCISVSNLSRRQSEYFHVNTTPDLPIKIAIRTSMSLPFAWIPVMIGGDLYVDGGVFNNYPLKAFDGWFLSTKREDGGLQKTLQSTPDLLDRDTELFRVAEAFSKTMSTSFAEVNMKTIGFCVSSDNSPSEIVYSSQLARLEANLSRRNPEANLSRRSISSRRHRATFDLNELESAEVPGAPLILPNTKLAQANKMKNNNVTLYGTTAEYEEAYVEMIRWLLVHMTNDNVVCGRHPQCLISTFLLTKLRSNPPNKPFTPELFGHQSWNGVVSSMDSSSKGYITRTDLSRWWGHYGVRNPYMKNREPARPAKTVRGFMGEILKSMYIVHEEALMRDKNNASRTCILNTHYIDTYDIDLEQADKLFLSKEGKATAMKWIENRANYLATKDDVLSHETEKIDMEDELDNETLGVTDMDFNEVDTVPEKMPALWPSRRPQSKSEGVNKDTWNKFLLYHKSKIDKSKQETGWGRADKKSGGKRVTIEDEVKLVQSRKPIDPPSACVHPRQASDSSSFISSGLQNTILPPQDPDPSGVVWVPEQEQQQEQQDPAPPEEEMT